MVENIIETKGLSIFYGDNEAVKNVSMRFRQKQVTAIIGPSGCGKSTLLRTFNRMNDFIPELKVKGQALYRGEDIYHPEVSVEELRKKIGMVFQKPNPFPKTIYKNISWGPELHGVKGNIDELVESSLRSASLWNEVKDRLHDSALELSGGQQQRLCIARAIALKPDVILMDEPCSALDPKSTAGIEQLISRMKKEYTILIVTHNMQQASRVSDETAFFCDGKLIEFDETKKLFTKPSQKATEDYITGRFG